MVCSSSFSSTNNCTPSHYSSMNLVQLLTMECCLHHSTMTKTTSTTTASSVNAQHHDGLDCEATQITEATTDSSWSNFDTNSCSGPASVSSYSASFLSCSSFSSTSHKKSVSFNLKVRVRRIASRKRYTAEERLKSWWNEDENKAIRNDAVAVVRQMMKGTFVESSTETRRGLEFKVPKRNRERQANKRDIIETVLEEQHKRKQQSLGAAPDDVPTLPQTREWCDDDLDSLLADTYSACNWQCSVAAQKPATRDAKEAVSCWL